MSLTNCQCAECSRSRELAKPKGARKPVDAPWEALVKPEIFYQTPGDDGVRYCALLSQSWKDIEFIEVVWQS